MLAAIEDVVAQLLWLIWLIPNVMAVAVSCGEASGASW